MFVSCATRVLRKWILWQIRERKEKGTWRYATGKYSLSTRFVYILRIFSSVCTYVELILFRFASAFFKIHSFKLVFLFCINKYVYEYVLTPATRSSILIRIARDPYLGVEKFFYRISARHYGSKFKSKYVRRHAIIVTEYQRTLGYLILKPKLSYLVRKYVANDVQIISYFLSTILKRRRVLRKRKRTREK